MTRLLSRAGNGTSIPYSFCPGNHEVSAAATISKHVQWLTACETGIFSNWEPLQTPIREYHCAWHPSIPISSPDQKLVHAD